MPFLNAEASGKCDRSSWPSRGAGQLCEWLAKTCGGIDRESAHLVVRWTASKCQNVSGVFDDKSFKFGRGARQGTMRS